VGIAEKKPPDRGQIHPANAPKLRCFARHLGVSPAVVRQVVLKVGNSAAAVRKEVALSAQAAASGKSR